MSLSYEVPGNSKFVPGATAPTPTEAARVSEVAAVYTGDGESTSFTLTHNLEVSATDLGNGLPEVEFEPLTAAFWTEEPVITSKTENTVVLAVTGASSAAFVRVRVKRPSTLVR